MSKAAGIQRLNTLLAHKDVPLKFGGIFHAGVEVVGKEWSFAYTDSVWVDGVSNCEPKAHSDHHFRQTIQMSPTNLSVSEIECVIESLAKEYPGTSYNILRKNCCHFADDFCQRLGVGSIPGWLYRLARLGAVIDRVLQVSEGIQEKLFA